MYVHTEDCSTEKKRESMKQTQSVTFITSWWNLFCFISVGYTYYLRKKMMQSNNYKNGFYNALKNECPAVNSWKIERIPEWKLFCLIFIDFWKYEVPKNLYKSYAVTSRKKQIKLIKLKVWKVDIGISIKINFPCIKLSLWSHY